MGHHPAIFELDCAEGHVRRALFLARRESRTRHLIRAALLDLRIARDLIAQRPEQPSLRFYQAEH